MTFLAPELERSAPDEPVQDGAAAAPPAPELPRLPAYYLKHVWDDLAGGDA